MSKVTVELTTDQIDSIIIKDLKRSYKTILGYPNHARDEREILAALEVLICFYMVHSDGAAWIKKQKEKVSA